MPFWEKQNKTLQQQQQQNNGLFFLLEKNIFIHDTKHKWKPT